MRGAIKRDPVCGRRINRNKAHVIVTYKGQEYLLCCPKCQSEFEKDPELYCMPSRGEGNARHRHE